MRYLEGLEEFKKQVKKLGFEVSEFTEFNYESLNDFSKFLSNTELLKWYDSHVKASKMRVQTIPLLECKDWVYSDVSGAIEHSSGEFFSVEGVRVTGSNSREVKEGWDQPFIRQKGLDGGILGLVRKRFDGVPHYLVEAKEEPGNYNTVQISTTVQATFSNLKRAHKGAEPHYSKLFLYPEQFPVKIIFDQWTSEDGGRLFNKRNRSILIEYDEKEDFEIVSDRFVWVTLYQLKKLIKNQNAIVAPHIRGILAGL